MEAEVRRAFAKINPNLMVIRMQTLADQVDANFNQQLLIVRLTSMFGLLALILASIGLYGVTAYTVERRAEEIGAYGPGRESRHHTCDDLARSGSPGCRGLAHWDSNGVSGRVCSLEPII
jgi:hypothetical protein